MHGQQNIKKLDFMERGVVNRHPNRIQPFTNRLVLGRGSQIEPPYIEPLLSISAVLVARSFFLGKLISYRKHAD